MDNLLSCCDLRMDDILIFTVTDQEAGFLIGKGGNRVKSLRKNFDCDIDISGITPRIVYIAGKDKVRVYGKMLCSLKDMKK